MVVAVWGGLCRCFLGVFRWHFVVKPLALAGALKIFLLFCIQWRECRLLHLEALWGRLMGRLRFLGACGSLGFMLVLCYCESAWVSACGAGLCLLWAFLDLLLRGFGKIQMTQINQFGIYLHKISNVDSEYHKFSCKKL